MPSRVLETCDNVLAYSGHANVAKDYAFRDSPPYGKSKDVPISRRMRGHWYLVAPRECIIQFYNVMVKISHWETRWICE